MPLPAGTAAETPAPSALSASAERLRRFRSEDGLELAARIFGRPQPGRLPLLCLPGLSRNSRDFRGVGARFAVEGPDVRLVISLDYRGRGLSESDPNWRNYTPAVEAKDALAAATVLGIERAVVLGTSRGGIIAMILGAARPTLLAGVILNDIGPVIEGTGLARIKAHLSAGRRVAGWPAAIAALRQIAGGSFPALTDDDWKALAEAIYIERNNGLEPDFDRNLLKTLRSFDFTAAVPVLWPQFDSLRHIPVLAIRGEHSDVLSERTLAAMAERHPGLETMLVTGQGHAPLLRDVPTLDRIAGFCRRCDGAAAGTG